MEIRNTDVVLVTGTRWFQKSAGNTYHVARVEVIRDGVTIREARSAMTDGYGNGYVQTAAELLEMEYADLRALPGLRMVAQDVARQRDLFF